MIKLLLWSFLALDWSEVTRQGLPYTGLGLALQANAHLETAEVQCLIDETDSLYTDFWLEQQQVADAVRSASHKGAFKLAKHFFRKALRQEQAESTAQQLRNPQSFGKTLFNQSPQLIFLLNLPTNANALAASNTARQTYQEQVKNIVADLLRQDSKNLPALALQGLLLLLVNDREGAINSYGHLANCLEKDTTSQFLPLRNHVRLNQARFLALQGNYSLSQTIFKDLLAKQPNQAKWWFELNATYFLAPAVASVNINKIMGQTLVLSHPFIQQTVAYDALWLPILLYYRGCRYDKADFLLNEKLHRSITLLQTLETILLQPDTEIARLVQPKGLAHHPDKKIIWPIFQNDPEMQALAVIGERLQKEQHKAQRLRQSFWEAFNIPKTSFENTVHQQIEQLQRLKVYQATQLLFRHYLALKKAIATMVGLKIEIAEDIKEQKERALAQLPDLNYVEDQPLLETAPNQEEWWPYRGEFWQDELLHYEPKLRICPHKVTDVLIPDKTLHHDLDAP